MARPTRADIVRESVKAKERTRAKPKAKDGKSRFDQVKEQLQRLQRPAVMRQTSQTATEQAVRHVRREDDRGRDKKKHDKGEEKEGRKGTDGDRKADGKDAEQRVVAKRGMSDEGRGGRGGGKGGGGFSRRGGTTARRAKAGESRQAPLMLKAQFARKLASAAKQPSRMLSQKVLSQIVQYVRIAVNSDEQKEIRIDLHEKIFKGLKLRVASTGKGKVAVHFTAATEEVRNLFENSRDSIRRALKRKGIDVAEISVT